MKYLVVIIGAFILWVAPDSIPLSWKAAFVGIIFIVAWPTKTTKEYKVLQKIDGFGTTYIPVLAYRHKWLWSNWTVYKYVHPERIDDCYPDKHTYFEGAKFVIEEYKRFLEKSKVKVEIDEKDIG